MADRRGRVGHTSTHGATTGCGVSELRRATAFSCRAASGTPSAYAGPARAHNRISGPCPGGAARCRQPTLEVGVGEVDGFATLEPTTGALLGGIGGAVTSTLA